MPCHGAGLILQSHMAEKCTALALPHHLAMFVYMTSQAWVIVISLTFKSKKCSRLSWPIFLFVTIFCLGPQPAAQRGHSLGGSSLLRRWPHGVLQHELQGSFRYNLGGWMDGHGFPPEIKRNPIKSPVFYSFPGKGSGASSIKKTQQMSP